jgi:hypothetical protein
VREGPDVGMIKAIRKRARPDNLKNQVRAGGKSLARRLYLFALSGVGVILVTTLIGPLLFLDADGLVMRERSIISPDYNARVMAVHVKPGDQVVAGQQLISVVSSETLDRIADLTAKVAALSTRADQPGRDHGACAAGAPPPVRRRAARHPVARQPSTDNGNTPE